MKLFKITLSDNEVNLLLDCLTKYIHDHEGHDHEGSEISELLFEHMTSVESLRQKLFVELLNVQENNHGT